MTTPFNNWSEEAKEDPHGDHYHGDIVDIAMGDMPDVFIATQIESRITMSGVSSTVYLTAAKERLRWLSRAVQNALFKQDKSEAKYNEARSKMLLGELPDDILANRFFLTEKVEDIHAGAERIKWLSKVLSELTGRRGWK